MNVKKLCRLIALVVFAPLLVFAGESRRPLTELVREGFRPQVRGLPNHGDSTRITPHSLPWPIQFLSQRYMIGNSMSEYQNYGDEAYYHGGDDLRVSLGAEVRAPVSGQLIGQYYSYTTDPVTGQDIKHVKSFAEGGDPLYFEILISTDQGFYVELHHVDPRNLPVDIVKMIRAGGGFVEEGRVVGKTVRWPALRYGARYDHIHYNVITNAGVQVNPQMASYNLNDKVAPQLINVYTVLKDMGQKLTHPIITTQPDELIVEAVDFLNENIYPLAVTYVGVHVGQKVFFSWDFTQFLLGENGMYPPLSNVYKSALSLDSGEVITTQGDYERTRFLYRLPIPPIEMGEFEVVLKDLNDNETKMRIRRKPGSRVR
jgi:hypothetical protein